MTKKAYLLTFGLLLVPLAYGSGAYIPGGGARSEAYNQGKALVSAQGGDGCKRCHASYKRNNLKNLNKKVAEYVTDCSAHEPCFVDKFNEQQLVSISTYFKQRYKLN